CFPPWPTSPVSPRRTAPASAPYTGASPRAAWSRHPCSPCSSPPATATASGCGAHTRTTRLGWRRPPWPAESAGRRGCGRGRVQRGVHELAHVSEVGILGVDPVLGGELDRGDRLLLRLQRELGEVPDHRLRD